MNKEQNWLNKRVGLITASELGDLTSASGKIIETNLSYIRKKRFERAHGFTHSASSKIMDIGDEQEPYICAWARENLDLGCPIVYSKELPEIPLWSAPDCPMGASPDAFTDDRSVILEFKTLVGATGIEFFADEYTSYDEKKDAVWKDHGPQILGLLISEPKAEKVILIKYIYCDDEILKDTDSPLAPWRGLVFEFKREDLSEQIEELKARIKMFDEMISSKTNPSDFKKK